jgi:iron(III) transport system substrate-binding protein
MPRGVQRSLLAGLLGIGVLLSLVAASACGGDDQGTLTIYAGRSQQLVHPILEAFSEETGIPIQVRYGDGTELALGILEEGESSPADIYYTQDVGALGALKDAGRLQELPEDILDRVTSSFRDVDGQWVGVSGRSRVVIYNTSVLDPESMPESILDYTNPEWEGRLGIVPRSDGFPEFVTALRLTRGEDFARQWLTDLAANNPLSYPNNLSAMNAVANGEIDVAFLNHYYLYRVLEEQGEDYPVRNYYFDNGDIGGLFVVAGAAVLDTADNREAAEDFVAFMLSRAAQEYFTNSTQEYPMVEGIATSADLPPLSELSAPDVDLANVSDLRGSLELMQETGILP